MEILHNNITIVLHALYAQATVSAYACVGPLAAHAACMYTYWPLP